MRQAGRVQVSGGMGRARMLAWFHAGCMHRQLPTPSRPGQKSLRADCSSLLRAAASTRATAYSQIPHTHPALRRSILYALSFFHAALLERKKFGVGNQPGARSGIGWNMTYPFNTGDLLCCAQLAANYLDNNSKVGGWVGGMVGGLGTAGGGSCARVYTAVRVWG